MDNAEKQILDIEKKVKEPMRIKILYVDDEQNNLIAFKAAFRREYDIKTALSSKEGKELMKENEFHIILSDQRMPEQTGVEFFEEIRHIYPQLMRILVTGYTDIQAVIEAINRGEVYRYVTKPWVEEDLRITIKQAFEIFSLREENAQLTESLIQANKQLEFLLRQRLLS